MWLQEIINVAHIIFLPGSADLEASPTCDEYDHL